MKSLSMEMAMRRPAMLNYDRLWLKCLYRNIEWIRVETGVCERWSIRCFGGVGRHFGR
jgi:hypothetical protein